MADQYPQVDAAAVVSLLRQKKLTLSTAESCTGGLLSAAVTAVPGASVVFSCGVIAYTAACKRDLLAVPEQLLSEHGTVSAAAASAMADGVRRKENTSLSVAITGVAGPDPSEGKPVGTVYIALCDEERVWTRTLTPDDGLTGRDAIRRAAVLTALNMIQEYAQAYPAMIAGSLPITPPAPAEVIIPVAPTTGTRRRFLAVLLPWKGDTVRERIIKIGAWLLTFVLTAVLIFTTVRLISGSENQSLYQDLQNIYSHEEDVSTAENGMLSRFASLYSQNADIGGWIRIDGTGIGYPVMKNAGSNFYENHNFLQQYSAYGVPYFHSRNSLVSPDVRNKVLIVYGNNTGDGQMFADLLQYRDLNFFREHAVVDMSTLFSADQWLLFGVMVLDPNEVNAFSYAQTSFADDDAFLSYVTEIRKRSLWNTSVEINADDELLLLVTQAEEAYRFADAKIVVVGRRLRGEEMLLDDAFSVSRNSTVLMPRVLVRQNRSTTSSRRTTATAETTTATVPPTTVTTSTTSDVTAAPTTGTSVATTASSADERTTVSDTEPTEPSDLLPDGPTDVTTGTEDENTNSTTADD